MRPRTTFCSDSGSELAASSTRAWLARVATDSYCIDPSSPWENGYVESLKTRLRDELLDREIFHQLRGLRCCPDGTGRLTTASDHIPCWPTDRLLRRPSSLQGLSRCSWE